MNDQSEKATPNLFEHVNGELFRALCSSMLINPGWFIANYLNVEPKEIVDIDPFHNQVVRTHRYLQFHQAVLKRIEAGKLDQKIFNEICVPAYRGMVFDQIESQDVYFSLDTKKNAEQLGFATVEAYENSSPEEVEKITRMVIAKLIEKIERMLPTYEAKIDYVSKCLLMHFWKQSPIKLDQNA